MNDDAYTWWSQWMMMLLSQWRVDEPRDKFPNERPTRAKWAKRGAKFRERKIEREKEDFGLVHYKFLTLQNNGMCAWRGGKNFEGKLFGGREGGQESAIIFSHVHLASFSLVIHIQIDRHSPHLRFGSSLIALVSECGMWGGCVTRGNNSLCDSIAKNPPRLLPLLVKVHVQCVFGDEEGTLLIVYTHTDRRTDGQTNAHTHCVILGQSV